MSACLILLLFWCSYHMLSCLCSQWQEVSWTRTWSIIWASASRNPRLTTNCSRLSETTSTVTPCLVSPWPSYTLLYHSFFSCFFIRCSTVFSMSWHLYEPFFQFLMIRSLWHTLFVWVPTEHRRGSKDCHLFCELPHEKQKKNPEVTEVSVSAPCMISFRSM